MKLRAFYFLFGVKIFLFPTVGLKRQVYRMSLKQPWFYCFTTNSLVQTCVCMCLCVSVCMFIYECVCVCEIDSMCLSTRMCMQNFILHFYFR